ncbi:hypothetical protein CGRA01v4_13378 [Colletotrichum graminicola]|nr:hypothetical protein CGRA01v4_13378 [Colletotrichum graminicola]
MTFLTPISDSTNGLCFVASPRRPLSSYLLILPFACGPGSACQGQTVIVKNSCITRPASRLVTMLRRATRPVSDD